MKVVPDILQQFIEGMDFSSPIASISGAVVEVEDVFHARDKSKVLLDLVEYTVLSVDYNLNKLTLTAPVAGSPSTYSIASPKFFHGTPYATNSQLSKMKAPDKVPMVYLMEILRETGQAEDSKFGTVADCRLFFLDVANSADWSTDQHYSNVIIPMRNLVHQFIRQSRLYSLFGIIGEHDIYTHVKFGQFTDQKGHNQSIFNERLSGIEVVVSIPIKFCCNC